MAFEEKLKRYAELAVRSGCNLQKGQDLYVTVPICAAEFARMAVKCAYEAGARQVTVQWTDEAITRMGYEYSPLEVYEQYPEWMAVLRNRAAEQGAAMLFIDASNPGAMAGIDPRKPAASSRASNAACKPYRDAVNQGKVAWCIIAAAAPDWAAKVFPELPADAALERLWDCIFQAVRVDQPDPIEAWEAHRRSFEARRGLLNKYQFDRLHYRNGHGTDITIGLPENHEWAGGGADLADGRYFFPNMPTEEIFCSPHRDRAEGVVHSALPLNYHGNLIDDFSITFRDGKAVDCSAAKGYEMLKELIATDENACRLGEAALIPACSPIAQMGVLFYNTLYDENASCHFALGRGFSECVQGGMGLSEEDLTKRGVNASAAHVDFMIGTSDLSITGITKDGEEIPVFVNGNWAPEFQG